jgi:hypothetical protein
MSKRLPADVLALLRDTQEVEIETRPAPDVPPHLTVIWVVVDEQDRALIRTYRGPRSRWYREATADGTARIHAGGYTIDVRVEHAADPERVEACSEALRRKYASSRASLAAMLVPEVLPTTLELLPG